MKNTTKILILIIVILVGGYAFVGTDDKIASKTKVAVMAPLSGDFAFYGEDLRDGVFEGFLDNQTVEVVLVDTQCDPKKAVGGLNKLSSIDGVKYIIGPGCGSPQESVAPLLDQKGMIALLPSAASLNSFNTSNKRMLNIQYSLEDESKFIAEQMNREGYKKVALITYANSFSQAHKKGFEDNFSGEILNLEFNDLYSDISTELLKVKNEQGVEAIYVSDISFFVSGGISKINDLNLGAKVYSNYVAELPAVRQVVEGVTYSFGEGIEGKEGGTHEVAKQAARMLGEVIKECEGADDCIQKEFLENRDGLNFDDRGVYKRDFIWKKIEGGEVVKL